MVDHVWKVLIIDDSPEDRSVFRYYLSRDTQTYQIREANNGQRGFAEFKTFQPDCILLDYNLPDMDGVQFLHLLQERYTKHQTAVVFLTGCGNEEIAVRAMKQGAHDYLVKINATPDILKNAIMNAMVKAELLHQIEQQNRSFQILAENIPDAIVRLDSDFRYLYANSAIKMFTGLEPEALLGKTHQELALPAEYIQAWEQALAEIMVTKQMQIIEYPCWMEPEMRHYQTQYIPEFDMQKNIISILCFTRDITSYHDLLERQDESLGLVSHELRTPMTAIRGNIQLAMRRLKQTEDKIETAEAKQTLEGATMLLLRAIRQLGVQNRLIDDLLDISRIQKNTLELQVAPCDLLEVVREAVEEQRTIATDRTIELDLSDNSSPLMVLIDQTRIGQVINNYMTNALRYSEKTKPISVGVAQEDHQVKVWVKDDGLGLSEEQQQRIWEPFYQEKQPGYKAGLGLGLSICQVIIHAHEGTVGVESTQGKGSTFWFRLPLIEL